MPACKNEYPDKLVAVGMGATMYNGTDKRPFTIIEVKGQKTIVVQADKVTGTRDGGYNFHQNENGITHVVTKRKDGKWKVRGNKYRVVEIGYRTYYDDPSF